ncbi:MAG: glycosyltransferase family 4 protein [Salegentibacter sp.]
MKIALCSKGNFSLEKGFTKNRIELAESLEKLGWETVLVDKQKLGIPSEERYQPQRHSLALKEYLLKNQNEFDVVLYEYDTLPFDRNIFSENTLFVARPAILAYHFPRIKFRYNLKTRLSLFYRKFSKYLKGKSNPQPYLERVQYCLSQSDLIQVQNKKDRDLLVQKGFSSEKIIIVPNGVTPERISDFGDYHHSCQEPFKVAFVGSFDFRKGAMDFPHILKELKRQFPSIKFKLLGTRGMFQTREQVLKFFPAKDWESIEVKPNFKAEELPGLLEDCHVGIFPSYLESFGFGALEMMCAGLPVVAYNSPGPSDFVLPELLVPRGKYIPMAEKVIALLEDEKMLRQFSERARQTVLDNYRWDEIAKKVDNHYRTHLSRLQKMAVAG